MKTLPDNVEAYKRTPIFTNATIPTGFLKNHNTKQNIWALIHVIEGKLEYSIEDNEVHVLQPGKNGIIEPEIIHCVKPLGKVAFYVEFYKNANCIVPSCNGVSYDHLLSSEDLWDKYYMAAPKRHRQFVGQSKIVKRV